MAPRNLVNLERVSKGYGTRVLLDAVSLGVADGERIGVVGRNGDGKSTLLGVLAGQVPPDTGRTTHAGGLRLGLLAQHDALDPVATIRAVVIGTREAHEWAGDARVRDVLTGLLGGLEPAGFADGLDTVVGPLSGGERRRIALAALLIADHDLLVLDEPTNHLDVEGVDWLARHLAARKGALAVVTHDRWFLDAVCLRTWEVADGGVHEYDGGYSAYVLAKAERSRVAASDEARRQNLLRKELAWLRRGPPARTSKPRFRIDAANALIADEPVPRDSVELLRFASARLGRTVLELADVDYEIAGRRLLSGVTWSLAPGERVGVVGVNGSGKTTLLRLLSGTVAPTSGRVVTGVTVRIAFLSQEVTELPAGQRVLESVEEIARVLDLGKGRTLTAAQLCERLGFPGHRQWTPVGDLSGGERRRLQLVRLLMGEPNVLLLDEPTNDLDIDTLTALEDLLDGWAGSVVVVSHDRYFVERVCDRAVALLGDGDLRDLPGGVEQYLDLRRAGSAREAAPSSPAGGPARPSTPPVDPRAARKEASKELTRVERLLARLSTEESRLHVDLAAHATDHLRVGELDARLRALAVERAELEHRWLELAEAVP